MRAAWLGRRVAVASVAAASMVGLVGVGTAQAAPAKPAAMTVSHAATATPLSACTGRKVAILRWYTRKKTYAPGSNVDIRGRVENCTRTKLKVRIRGTILAPCGRVNVTPYNTTLTKKEQLPVYIPIDDLPSTNNGKSCKGTWKPRITVTSGGKVLAVKTTSFKES